MVGFWICLESLMCWIWHKCESRELEDPNFTSAFFAALHICWPLSSFKYIFVKCLVGLSLGDEATQLHILLPVNCYYRCSDQSPTDFGRKLHGWSLTMVPVCYL